LTYDQRRSGRHVLNLREEASGQQLDDVNGDHIAAFSFRQQAPEFDQVLLGPGFDSGNITR